MLPKCLSTSLNDMVKFDMVLHVVEKYSFLSDIKLTICLENLFNLNKKLKTDIIKQNKEELLIYICICMKDDVKCNI